MARIEVSLLQQIASGGRPRKDSSMTRSPWPAADPELLRFIEGWKATVSSTYREDPLLLEEHARQENSFRTSGYSRRQVTELVQNAADAIFKSGTTGRIEIRLTDDHLYCANDG
ncbi:hypothetical protein, partial [Luteolibacter marinus]|uniref:hypothetical protein n=1 Tax=Luteolibacter marinus TaxID=2776705 RepID=UPI001868C815